MRAAHRVQPHHRAPVVEEQQLPRRRGRRAMRGGAAALRGACGGACEAPLDAVAAHNLDAAVRSAHLPARRVGRAVAGVVGRCPRATHVRPTHAAGGLSARRGGPAHGGRAGGGRAGAACSPQATAVLVRMRRRPRRRAGRRPRAGTAARARAAAGAARPAAAPRPRPARDSAVPSPGTLVNIDAAAQYRCHPLGAGFGEKAPRSGSYHVGSQLQDCEPEPCRVTPRRSDSRPQARGMGPLRATRPAHWPVAAPPPPPTARRRRPFTPPAAPPCRPRWCS